MSEKSGKGDEGTGRSSKLDSYSKEDLIKYVKKQAITLQRTRAKCDELSTQLVQKAEFDSSDASLDGRNAEHVQNLEEQLLDLSSQKEGLAQKLNGCHGKIQSLQEQLDCMRMKDETLTSSLQCMQDEHVRLSNENKALQDQVQVLADARDGALEQIKVKQTGPVHHDITAQLQELEQEKDDLSKQLAIHKSRYESATQSLEESSDQFMKLTRELDESKSAEQMKSSELSKFKDLYEKLKERHQTESQDFNELYETMKDEKDHLTLLVQRLKVERSGIEVEKEQLSTQLKQREGDVTALKVDFASMMKNMDLLQQQATSDEQKKMDMMSKWEGALASVDGFKERVSDLETLVEKLTAQCQDYEQLKEMSSSSSVSIDALKAEVTQLHADVEQVRRERDELVGTRESYVAEIDELKEEKEMLKHETQIAQEESEKFEEMIEKLENDKNIMSNQLETLSQQQVNVRDTVIEILRQYYEKIQPPGAKDEVAELEDDTVENNLQLIRNLVNQLFMEKEKVSKENLDMCVAKNDELDSLQRSFAKKQEDSEAAESEKESLSVVNQLLQEKGCDLKEEIGILKIEVDKLEMENQDLASKLASFGDLMEITDLKQNFVSSTEKNEELEKELKEEAEKAAFMQKDLIEQKQYAIELEEKILQMSDGMAKMRQQSEHPSDEVKTEVEDDLLNQVTVLEEKLTESDKSCQEKIETTHQEYVRLKSHYDGLVSVLEATKESFEKCENDKNNMEKNVDDLSKEKAALEETINEKSKLYESQNIEAKEVQDRNNVLVKESESMKETINGLESQLDGLSSMSDKFENSAVEMKKMEESLRDMVNKLESKDIEKQSLNDEMVKMQGIIDRLQADIDNVNGEKHSLEMQRSELETKLSGTDNALQDTVNELQEEKMRLLADLSAASTDIESLKVSAASVVTERDAQETAASDRMAQLESEKNDMLKEYDTVKSEIDSKEEKISKLELEICNLNQVNQTVNGHLEKASSEKDALVQSTDELVTKIQHEKDAVGKSLKDLHLKLEEKDSEVKQYEDQNKTLSEQLAHSHKANRGNLENELENYKSNSEQLKDENDSLKMHLELKSSEKESLQKEYDSLKREKDSLNKKMEMTSEKRDNMVVVVEELKNRMAQKDSLLAEMEHSTQEEIEDLQNALRDHKDVVSKVTKQNSDFSIVLQELEEKNIEIYREKAELTSEVQRLKASIQEMTAIMSERNVGVDQVTLENVKLKENISISFQRESELQNKFDMLARDKNNFSNILSSLKNVLTHISTEIGKNDIETQFPSSESGNDDWSVTQWSSFCIRYLESFSAISQGMVTVREAWHSIKAENTHLRAQLDEARRDIDKHQQHANQVSAEQLFAVQKQLHDKEEMCTKLKTLAVKSKKEASELRSQKGNLTRQIESLRQDYADVVNRAVEDPSTHEEIEKQQFEIARLEKSLEEITADLWKNQRDLDLAARELTSVRQQHAELKDQKEAFNKQIEHLDNEKKSLETRLSAQDLEQSSLRIQLEELQKDKTQIQNNMTEKESVIAEIKEEHSQSEQALQKALESTKKELEHAKHEAKQSSMMGLEIDDYERTLENLNTRLADKDSIVAERDIEINRLNERVNQLQKEIAAVESQHVQSDERGNRLKQLLVKTKKDLADAKKTETEQRSSDAHLRGKLEHFNQQSEDYKVQISSLTSEKQKLQDQVRAISESHQRTVRSLESRIQSLLRDLEISQSELHSIQNEYESYKVRVHSVLKQQRSKSSSEMNVDLEKADRECLENALDHLQIKLQATNESLSSVKQENDLLQAEHDRLLQRHNNHLHDSQEKEAALKSRMEELSHANLVSHSEQSEVVKQLTFQNETLTSSFKGQIRHLQDDHQKALSMLQQQMEMAEDENYRLHQELSQQQSLASQQKPIKFVTVATTEKHLIEPLQINIDMKHEERQAGEGMEHTEIDLSSPITPVKSNSSILSFEQLLSQSPQDDQLSISSQISVVDVDVLKQNVLTAEKRILHLTDVLSESESTAMHLTEQAMVLKDEIRRLESNRRRDEEMHNLEYLKNIILKFLTLKSGDERIQLIPVITTMLKLSSDEKGLLNAVAEVDPSAVVQNSAGWGTYLHRWTSLS